MRVNGCVGGWVVHCISAWMSVRKWLSLGTIDCMTLLTWLRLLLSAGGWVGMSGPLIVLSDGTPCKDKPSTNPDQSLPGEALLELASILLVQQVSRETIPQWLPNFVGNHVMHPEVHLLHNISVQKYSKLSSLQLFCEMMMKVVIGSRLLPSVASCVRDCLATLCTATRRSMSRCNTCFALVTTPLNCSRTCSRPCLQSRDTPRR